MSLEVFFDNMEIILLWPSRCYELDYNHINAGVIIVWFLSQGSFTKTHALGKRWLARFSLVDLRQQITYNVTNKILKFNKVLMIYLWKFYKIRDFEIKKSVKIRTL